MDEAKRTVRLNARPVSIDGIMASGGSTRPYAPGRGGAAASLDNLIRRAEGFNGGRPAMQAVGASAEMAEAEALLDEPIVLDDEDYVAKKRSRSKPVGVKKAFKSLAIVLAVALMGVGGFLGWRLQHSVSKIFHGNLLGILTTTKLKGEDQGRVNILLAGNSADDPGHDGAELTDSIMLVSLDTVHHQGYILSIPRDLWVNYGTNNCSLGNSGKINAVYECGQETHFSGSGYPNGGMGLLEKNVQQYFGVTVDYYALIDYAALRDAANDVGGIPFTVKSDDPRGLYDPSIDYSTHKPLVNLSNGTHILNGQQALDLARARGDSYGSYGFPQADFNRTQNQRQMMLALKTKALSVGVLSNPAKVSDLLGAVGNNVHTDFKTSEVRRLYSLSKEISNNSIQSVGFNNNTKAPLLKGANIDGMSALVPAAGESDFSQLQAFVRKLDSNDPIAKEDASIEVLNGTNVNGLAAKTANNLRAKSLNVLGVDDATAHTTTTILDLNPKDTATKTLLEQTFKVTSTTDTSVYAQAKNYNADFVIILGEDAASLAKN